MCWSMRYYLPSKTLGYLGILVHITYFLGCYQTLSWGLHWTVKFFSWVVNSCSLLFCPLDQWGLSWHCHCLVNALNWMPLQCPWILQLDDSEHAVVIMAPNSPNPFSFYTSQITSDSVICSNAIWKKHSVQFCSSNTTYFCDKGIISLLMEHLQTMATISHAAVNWRLDYCMYLTSPGKLSSCYKMLLLESSSSYWHHPLLIFSQDLSC